MYFKNYLENVGTPKVKVGGIFINYLVFLKKNYDKQKQIFRVRKFIHLFFHLFSKDLFSLYNVLHTMLCAPKEDDYQTVPL